MILHSPPDDLEAGLSGLDVDCAVDGLDPRWPLRLDDGWRLCQCLHYDLKGWYWVLERDGQVVCLDTVDDPNGLGRDGLPTARFGPTDDLTAPGEVQAAYLTAKRVRKGDLREGEWRRIGRLAAAAPDRYRAALAEVVGGRLAGRLAGPALAGRPPTEAVGRRARRRQLVRRYRTPARAVAGLALGLRRELERVRRPTGLLVVVAGPDGSGESSLADALPERLTAMFRRGARIHWRPGLLPRPGAVVGREPGDPATPHARPPYGRALSAALLGYYWLDFLAGGWLMVKPVRARSGLVVMERGWWDLAVDPRRYRLQVPPGLVRRLGALLPRPDLTLVLESSPGRLRERKAFRWADQRILVDGQPAAGLPGFGYSMRRQRLLDILTARARELGVEVRFEAEVEDPATLGRPDLVVACDGVNSRLRRHHPDGFGTRIDTGRNRYMWLGTTKVFDSFTFAFVRTPAGWIWCHAYGFDAGTSTFIVECQPETWAGLGFGQLGLDDSIRRLEQLFEAHLDGHRLVAQVPTGDRTPWLGFRTVTNERWHHGRVVLAGDAAHTTHFTIGSGTKLAIEDAIGLAAALGDHRDLESALAAYEQQRKTALLLLQREAGNSARWFEDLPRYVRLGSPRFAALLHHRRSQLLTRMSPAGYYRLRWATERLPVLERLWHWASGRGRARYVRRAHTA